MTLVKLFNDEWVRSREIRRICIIEHTLEGGTKQYELHVTLADSHARNRNYPRFITAYSEAQRIAHDINRPCPPDFPPVA